MGLFGGGLSRGQIKNEMKRLEKTARKITIRCPKCGKVYNQTVYGSGSFQGRCSCGYTLTERDRY